MVSVPLRRSDYRLAIALTRVLLTLVVAAAVAVPVAGYVYAHHLVLLGARVSTPPAHLSPAALATYQKYASTGPSTFVVLGYSDLSTHPAADASTKASQTVAARAFAAQLAMLRAAGFVSVTETELSSYLSSGTALPPHSVLIAFDGGRVRDWTVADGLLAHYGFTAVVFVDPSSLAGKGSGYLSWTQLEQMNSSKRWSVGLDLSGSGAIVPLGPTNASGTGPAILSPAWLPNRDRVETTAEYSARMAAVIHGEIIDLTDHSIPSPLLLTYPFDPTYPLSRAQAGFNQLTTVVNSLVTAGILRTSPDTAVDDFYRRERLLPMLAVFSTTSTDGLFERILAAG